MRKDETNEHNEVYEKNEANENQTPLHESKKLLQKTDKDLQVSRETVQHIFDKIFKKVITLSGKAVINLINGLFDTDYPLDSEVTYNWTEFHDEELKKTLVDTIITIDGKYSYHLEAQISRDNEIIFRMFEYGFRHANLNREREEDNYILRFPKPVIIYLYYTGEVPDEYTLTLEFDEGAAKFDYTVPVIKLPELTVEELNEKKMVILIPFHLLKLRYWVQNGNVTEEALKKLVQDDIIGSINKNQQVGNITQEDALKLKRYTQKLAEYLYVTLDRDGLGALRDMTDESFMTDIDILCKEHEEAMAEKDQAAEKKLIKQVLRNYEKGKTPEEIADDLVESVEHVKQICAVIESVPDKENVDEIYKSLQKY